MNDNSVDEVAARIWNLAENHRQTWRDKEEWQWYLGLLEEVAELGLALAGWHKDENLAMRDDGIEWELRQIGSIAMNWIRHRDESKGAGGED